LLVVFRLALVYTACELGNGMNAFTSVCPFIVANLPCGPYTIWVYVLPTVFSTIRPRAS
jgi:hypothetical protein